MLIGIDYIKNGAEFPAMVVAANIDAAESAFRKDNPGCVIVRSWSYPDMYESAYLSASQTPDPVSLFGRRKPT